MNPLFLKLGTRGLLFALTDGFGYRAAIMKTYAYLALIVPLALSACGVPDIVAHGVKAYEKSQDQKDGGAQTQPASQPTTSAPAPVEVQQDAPPPIAPVPARDSVTKEKL